MIDDLRIETRQMAKQVRVWRNGDVAAVDQPSGALMVTVDGLAPAVISANVEHVRINGVWYVKMHPPADLTVNRWWSDLALKTT